MESCSTDDAWVKLFQLSNEIVGLFFGRIVVNGNGTALTSEGKSPMPPVR